MKFFDRILGRDSSYEVIPSDESKQSTQSEALFATEHTPLQKTLICLRNHVKLRHNTPDALEIQKKLEREVLDLMIAASKSPSETYQTQCQS